VQRFGQQFRIPVVDVGSLQAAFGANLQQSMLVPRRFKTSDHMEVDDSMSIALLMQKAPIQVSGEPWRREEPLVTVVVNAHG